MDSAANLPDGLDRRNIEARSWHRHASVASLATLATIVLLAATGLFGGYANKVCTHDTRVARITFTYPENIRNGEFFETTIEVEAKKAIVDLTIDMPSTYWRNITINSMIPSPITEKPGPSSFQLGYGPLDPGQKVLIKYDGQVNPSLVGSTHGKIKISDRTQLITAHEAQLRVYP